MAVKQQHHGNCYGNDCNENSNLEITGLFQLEIQNKQEAGYNQHDNQQPVKCRVWHHKAKQEGQRQNHRNGGDGKTVIDLSAAVGLCLTVGFQYIEERQTNYAAQAVKAHGDAAENTTHAISVQIIMGNTPKQITSARESS